MSRNSGLASTASPGGSIPHTLQESKNPGQEVAVAGILNLGVVDLGFESMPSPFDADQLMHDASGSEGLGEFLGLPDRDPAVARAMDQEHRGSIAADVLDRGSITRLPGGIRGLVAQEDSRGIMSEGLRSNERESLEVGWTIEADNRLDARAFIEAATSGGSPQEGGEVAASGLAEGRDPIRIDLQPIGVAADPAHGLAEVVEGKRPTGGTRPGQAVIRRDDDESGLGQADGGRMGIPWTGAKEPLRSADPAPAMDRQDRRARRAGPGRARTVRGKVDVKREAMAVDDAKRDVLASDDR